MLHGFNPSSISDHNPGKKKVKRSIINFDLRAYLTDQGVPLCYKNLLS